MTTIPLSSPPDEPQEDEGEMSRRSSDAAIRDHVMALLGRPPQLYRVSVLPLWANYYRVNVLVGVDPTAVLVAHSFFLETRDGGHIAKATPPITRMYP